MRDRVPPRRPPVRAGRSSTCPAPCAPSPAWSRLVYGFSEADTKGWSSPVTIALLVASVVLLAVFTWWQTRAAHPLLPLRIVRDRGRGGANLAVLLVGVAMFGVFLFLTYYLQEVLRYSPVMTGLGFLPMLGTVMVTATTSGMCCCAGPGPAP